MAISKKTLAACFGPMLRQTSHDPELALAQLRNALVAFERHEINRDSCLSDCDHALSGHGVEGIPDPNDSSRYIAEYVNMGDTYSCTILFSYRTARFYACSWGDWYEHTPEYRAYDARERRSEGRKRAGYSY